MYLFAGRLVGPEPALVRAWPPLHLGAGTEECCPGEEDMQEKTKRNKQWAISVHMLLLCTETSKISVALKVPKLKIESKKK